MPSDSLSLLSYFHTQTHRWNCVSAIFSSIPPQLLMGITLAGTVYIFVVPDYSDWCVFQCLCLCWLEFPSKFTRCGPGAAGKVERDSGKGERKGTSREDVRANAAVRAANAKTNVILGRKLIFSQTYFFFSESDPTIVASSEGLIIQQSHCAMTHFPPPPT